MAAGWQEEDKKKKKDTCFCITSITFYTFIYDFV